MFRKIWRAFWGFVTLTPPGFWEAAGFYKSPPDRFSLPDIPVVPPIPPPSPVKLTRTIVDGDKKITLTIEAQTLGEGLAALKALRMETKP